MSSKKLLQFLVAMLVFPVLTFAQNTTGNLSGSVKADNGEALVGATVTLLHVPTGTVYKVQAMKVVLATGSYLWLLYIVRTLCQSNVA